MLLRDCGFAVKIFSDEIRSFQGERVHTMYGVCVYVCSRIEMKGKHRGDMAKIECSLFEVYVFVCGFFFF